MFIVSDRNGAYLRYIVLILKSQWPRKHTENTEYSQIISVSSVDSVAIYHDFDLRGPRKTGINVIVGAGLPAKLLIFMCRIREQARSYRNNPGFSRSP